MLKTTVYLEEQLASAIKRISASQNRSQAELIRAALAEYVSKFEHQNVRKLPSGAGAFTSRRTDVSQRVRELVHKGLRRQRSGF